MSKLKKFAEQMYLDLQCARGYPEQQPEYVNAKASDLLWFLVPIAGMAIFLDQIERRGQVQK